MSDNALDTLPYENNLDVYLVDIDHLDNDQLNKAAEIHKEEDEEEEDEEDKLYSDDGEGDDED